MSTPWAPERAPLEVDARLAAMDGTLGRILDLLQARAEERQDVEEVVADLMPIANGMAAAVIRKLDGLERDGTLAAAAMLARAASAPAVLGTAGRAAVVLGRPPRPAGPLALLRALREPAVARGMGMMLELLRALGAEPTTSQPATASAPAQQPGG